MDPQDKIDLSSLNKPDQSTKQPKFSSPLKKKPAGPNRDHLGQFTSGSGGLLNTERFNWKRVLPLVAVVSLVGGYFVYQSFAGGYSITRNIRYQVNGGSLKVSNGVWRRNINGQMYKNSVSTLVSSQEASRTRQVCTTIVANNNARYNIRLVKFVNGSVIGQDMGGINENLRAGQRKQICRNNAWKDIGTFYVIKKEDNSLASAGVLAVYGLK